MPACAAGRSRKGRRRRHARAARRVHAPGPSPSRNRCHRSRRCSRFRSRTPSAKTRPKRLAYFQKEGVHLKVISGDNPAAVSAIAQKAGLPHAERYIDMSSVRTPEALAEAANEYTVFGPRLARPEKRTSSRPCRPRATSVAMTGDGVNDILALREADCSIAIAEGSDAARQVSQLVLLNSDFSKLPHVLAEGRRVVNNITRVAGHLLRQDDLFGAAVDSVRGAESPVPVYANPDHAD